MYRHFLKLLIVFSTAGFLSGCYMPQEAGKKTTKQRAMDKIRYISNDDQRDDLAALKTDAEVRAFMKDFWKSLDPDTNTVENEFKTLYEERFAYANKYCNEPYREGWQTDRGRVLIIYGPPDEVQDRGFMDQEVTLHGIPVKALQTWVYYSPPAKLNLPELFGRTPARATEFIFADIEGFGRFTQILSNSELEVNDVRVFGR